MAISVLSEDEKKIQPKIKHVNVPASIAEETAQSLDEKAYEVITAIASSEEDVKVLLKGLKYTEMYDILNHESTVFADTPLHIAEINNPLIHKILVEAMDHAYVQSSLEAANGHEEAANKIITAIYSSSEEDLKTALEIVAYQVISQILNHSSKEFKSTPLEIAKAHNASMYKVLTQAIADAAQKEEAEELPVLCYEVHQQRKIDLNELIENLTSMNYTFIEKNRDSISELWAVQEVRDQVNTICGAEVASQLDTMITAGDTKVQVDSARGVNGDSQKTSFTEASAFNTEAEIHEVGVELCEHQAFVPPPQSNNFTPYIKKHDDGEFDIDKFEMWAYQQGDASLEAALIVNIDGIKSVLACENWRYGNVSSNRTALWEKIQKMVPGLNLKDVNEANFKTLEGDESTKLTNFVKSLTLGKIGALVHEIIIHARTGFLEEVLDIIYKFRQDDVLQAKEIPFGDVKDSLVHYLSTQSNENIVYVINYFVKDQAKKSSSIVAEPAKVEEAVEKAVESIPEAGVTGADEDTAQLALSTNHDNIVGLSGEDALCCDNFANAPELHTLNN